MAHAALAAPYDGGLPPFYEGTHWTYPAPPELVQAAAAGFVDPNHFPLDARGLAYHYAYVGIKRLGAFYLINIKDKDGESYNGGKSYRLNVPANAPGVHWRGSRLYNLYRRDPLESQFRFPTTLRDALRARHLLDIQRHVEALRRDVVLGQFVATHQRHITHNGSTRKCST